VSALRDAGIDPHPVIALADHASPSPSDYAVAECASADVWLTTARCAVKLPARIGASPVLALDHRLDVGDLIARLPSSKPARAANFR